MAHILVVDDDALVRAAVRRVLTRAGYQVWDVPDGTEALELLDVIQFDLVLTDVYMNPMSGLELLARLRRYHHTMPVVVMSGGGSASREDLFGLATACGAQATLAKPFLPGQLCDAVSTALGSVPAVA